MSQTLFASFATESLAEKAAGALLDHGVRNEDISLVYNRATDSPASGNESVRHQHGSAGGGEGGSGDLMRHEEIGVSPKVGDSAYDAMGGMGLRTMDTGDMGPISVASALNNPGYFDTQEPYRDTAAGTAETADGEAASRATADSEDLSAKHGLTTTSPEDAGAGAIKGTAVGLGLGALAALAAVFVPGVGLVLGGGALAMRAGATALAAGAGAVSGGVAGYLKDQGVQSEYAGRYHETIAGGGVMIAVHTRDNTAEAEVRALLTKYGAQDISLQAVPH